jgi:hypothetical protein
MFSEEVLALRLERDLERAWCVVVVVVVDVLPFPSVLDGGLV